MITLIFYWIGAVVSVVGGLFLSLIVLVLLYDYAKEKITDYRYGVHLQGLSNFEILEGLDWARKKKGLEPLIYKKRKTAEEVILEACDE